MSQAEMKAIFCAIATFTRETLYAQDYFMAKFFELETSLERLYVLNIRFQKQYIIFFISLESYFALSVCSLIEKLYWELLTNLLNMSAAAHKSGVKIAVGKQKNIMYVSFM